MTIEYEEEMDGKRLYEEDVEAVVLRWGEGRNNEKSIRHLSQTAQSSKADLAVLNYYR